MSERPERPMRSIWFLVGLVLLAMGVVVAAAGVADLLRPPARVTLLGASRPALWWGLLLAGAGALFVAAERRRR